VRPWKLAGDGVALVEMTMLAGIELALAVVVEVGGNASLGLNRFEHSAMSRLATPSDLSGAVNRMRAPTEKPRSVCKIPRDEAASGCQVYSGQGSVKFLRTPCPRSSLRIHRLRSDLLPKPCRECSRVESNGISDFETWGCGGQPQACRLGAH
jgi:hypothetical protein